MWFSSAFQVSGQDLQSQFPQRHKGQWKDLLEVLHQANQAASSYQNQSWFLMLALEKSEG